MTIPQLAPEILQRIALCVATENPVGPPSSLLPLLTSSPQLYDALNARDHPHLYADIFRETFDTDAIQRRFPRAQLTAQALSVELQRRWTSLKRIRAMSKAHSTGWKRYEEDEAREDLMTAYLMLVESDGPNAVHLLQYAKLDAYLEAYMQRRLVKIHSEPVMPPESEESSLLLWVTWLVTDYREWALFLRQSGLRSTVLTPFTTIGKMLLKEDGRQLTWLMVPYILGTFFVRQLLFPSFCVPASHLDP